MRWSTRTERPDPRLRPVALRAPAVTAVVLVHSPVVGPATWAWVAPELVARRLAVAVPSLLAATREGPPFWQGQARAVAGAAAALPPPVVLVGHSGAGPLLPAAGAACEVAVAGYVFVDATLPHPGERRIDNMHPAFRAQLLSLAEGGELPPWDRWSPAVALGTLIPDEERRRRFSAELSPLPLAMFTEVLPDVPGWPDAPCAYLRLSSVYDGDEAEAASRGWPVSRLDGTHLEPLLRPDAVAEAILALVRRLGVPLPAGAGEARAAPPPHAGDGPVGHLRAEP